jgi:hypothetical protein
LNYVSITKGIGFPNAILLTLGGNSTSCGGAKVGHSMGEQYAFNLIVEFFPKVEKNTRRNLLHCNHMFVISV